jgi:hypothetical protein
MALSDILGFLGQNPIVAVAIILTPLALAAVIFLAMKALDRRDERIKAADWEVFQESRRNVEPAKQDAVVEKTAEAFPKPKNERELTMDDLRTREERLREREERLKKRKMLELDEKEKTVERKHVTGIVKEERKITDAIEEKRDRDQKLEETANNRKRLIKLMELAEDRYKDGLMSEKNFRNIMNAYQKELIEVDIDMNKLQGDSV